MTGIGKRLWTLYPILSLVGCAAPSIDDWPPAPVQASEDVIQQYVDRYAHKEQAPRVYTEIELRALKILQERTRYHDENASTSSIDNKPEADAASRPRDRSRAQINAIKRKVYRKYESAHDRRHELRSKYGL